MQLTESYYRPAFIESVRVINVNIQDWSVDCISEIGYKRFFDIQVMSPYLHYMNGEGIYTMPEIGAYAWLCKPSAGGFAPPFLMGFQGPFDNSLGNFRSGRPNLNPGDIMMRTRDENFLILRRGGVVQIGATPTAQRIFLPIRNFIKDFCENYQLFTFGGELTWETARTETTTTGEAPTTFALKAKSKATDPEHIATLTIGSHGEGSPTTLELTVFASGAKGAQKKVSLVLTKEGDVIWDVQSSWECTVQKDYAVSTVSGDISLDSGKDLILTAKANVEVAARGTARYTADGTAEIVGTQGVTVDGASVKLGGAGAVEPLVYGMKLSTLLGKIIAAVAVANPAAGPLAVEIPTIISPKCFTS